MISAVRYPRRESDRRRRGAVLVLALGLVTVMMALAVAFVSATSTTVKQADNFSNIEAAHRQAESGLAFFTYLLRNTSVTESAEGASLVEAVADGLRAQLDGSATLRVLLGR